MLAPQRKTSPQREKAQSSLSKPNNARKVIPRKEPAPLINQQIPIKAKQ